MQSYKQEIGVLKSHLASAQEDVETLLNEKKNLLDTIRMLQVSKKKLTLCFKEKYIEI